MEDVDFLGASLAINRNLVEVKGKVMLGPPKTRASIRRVSLPTFLVEELALHLATWPTDRDGVYLHGTRWWAPATDKFPPSGVGAGYQKKQELARSPFTL